MFADIQWRATQILGRLQVGGVYFNAEISLAGGLPFINTSAYL